MYKIGLVDLDTSHARSFAKRLNDMGDMRICGVFDAGQVCSADKIEAFCKELDCVRYGTVEELAGVVDAAMVLSADWQVHLDRCVPLAKAGKAFFVDKPLAGSIKDLDKFEAIVEQTGVPVLGTSGWRFAEPVRKARKNFTGRQIDSVFAMMHRNFMYYGVHSVEMIAGFLGWGIESVKFVKKDDSVNVILFQHATGTTGYMSLGMPIGCFEYGLWAFVEGKPVSVTFDAEAVHNGVCENFAEMVRTGKSPVSARNMTESVRVMLAALQSWETGESVKIADVSPRSYDSGNFMKEYIEQVRKTTK